ncbi:hypothetical protein HHK36_002187 [Tetracentron sinense]|uniref:Uncharacterized protein n=1 Tax=Tetracentron sinense TaxID=13715 RepID=A0A834ZZE6_TETSI|nr:hypothetical protein HHK36_002187 [Tetracentron sinense]
MQLKEELTLIKRENKTIQEYLYTVKSLGDEIALIDHSISDDDLTLYILNGLGPDFREIAAPIRAREKSLTFEELHDLLMGHEAYLRRLEAATQQLVATTNFSSRSGSNRSGDLANLSVHSEYDGTDEVVIGDGSETPFSTSPVAPLGNPSAMSPSPIASLHMPKPPPMRMDGASASASPSAREVVKEEQPQKESMRVDEGMDHGGGGGGGCRYGCCFGHGYGCKRCCSYAGEAPKVESRN